MQTEEERRKCGRERIRKFRIRHPDAIMKKKYGLTMAEYVGILSAQGGKCAVCGKEPLLRTDKSWGLCVDHDHTTGKVRGLLCSSCNVILGHVHDNPDILMKLVDYLRCH